MQLTTNVGISLVWAFLHTSYTFMDFAVGFVLGAIVIGFFGRVVGFEEFYLWRLLKGVKLFLIFLKELVVACMQVLYQVVQPQLQIKPGIIRMEIDLPTDFQVTLLANMITLTPGTMTMGVTPDNRALYIHVLNVDDADQVRVGIKKSFEDNIREVGKK